MPTISLMREPHERSHWYPDHEVLTAAAGLVACLTILPIHSQKPLFRTKASEEMLARARLQNNTSTIPTIPTIRSALRYILLPPKADRSRTSITASNNNSCYIYHSVFFLT